ncbi:cell division protein FtsQ/DivIB [Sporolactobacillus shoreae]|nr:FtsQ-type POTRA domain-containing protein [Sporolactobacillus shoreae]
MGKQNTIEIDRKANARSAALPKLYGGKIMDRNKVIPLEDRLPQLKKERKQKANRRFALYATIFFLLILAVVYFQSPLSRVSRISVSGQQIVSRSEVLRASGISNKTHIWDVGSGNVEKQIEKLPSIQHASVRKAFPNSVSIHIQEYGRKAYLLKNGTYFPILQNGTLLGPLQKGFMPTDAPILVNFTNPSALKEVSEGLAAIPASLVHGISDIHYINGGTDPDNLILYMNDGNRVVANSKTFGDNIKLYPEILANLPNGEHGTVHLSVGSYFVPDQSPKSNNH